MKKTTEEEERQEDREEGRSRQFIKVVQKEIARRK